MMCVAQVEEMGGERHALESSVIEMNTKGAQIERWLADNESKMPTGPPPCPKPAILRGLVNSRLMSVPYCGAGTTSVAFAVALVS